MWKKIMSKDLNMQADKLWNSKYVSSLFRAWIMFDNKERKTKTTL